MSKDEKYLDKLSTVSLGDVDSLLEAQKNYGNSWKKRGGVGAFMMLARKWDRLEKQAEEKGWDIFQAIQDDQRPEGIIDDIRDLRRYLLLVEAEMIARKAGTPKQPDNVRVCQRCRKIVPRLYASPGVEELLCYMCMKKEGAEIEARKANWCADKAPRGGAEGTPVCSSCHKTIPPGQLIWGDTDVPGSFCSLACIDNIKQGKAESTDKKHLYQDLDHLCLECGIPVSTQGGRDLCSNCAMKEKVNDHQCALSGKCTECNTPISHDKAVCDDCLEKATRRLSGGAIPYKLCKDCSKPIRNDKVVCDSCLINAGS
ncbi:MAG: hypothetical protein KAR40_06270 [Candidatus Sabulitectum sp.]|nr:hypothetical protein [Candidatus Sabulitectum sp.]